MKKRVIAVIAVLALSVAMFGCKAGSDTGNGKKQREESAGDMGTEGKATAEEETEIQVFIAASLNTVMTELAKVPVAEERLQREGLLEAAAEAVADAHLQRGLRRAAKARRIGRDGLAGGEQRVNGFIHREQRRRLGQTVRAVGRGEHRRNLHGKKENNWLTTLSKCIAVVIMTLFLVK